MKLDWKLIKADKVKELAARYKYALIIVAVGILLLAWPPGETNEKQGAGQSVREAEEIFSVEQLEERLSKVLSKIDGAGEVSVVLTVQKGSERILATDKVGSQRENAKEMEEKVVLIDGSEGEEAVLLSQKYPVFQGALIVCSGGDDPQVRLWMTQAVSVLTGLGADRITVCKGS